MLNFIMDWVSNSHNANQNILWLHGLTGSGKSTLATSIANIFRDSGQLGVFLFFDRDVTEGSDLMLVVRTLAHQLGSSDPTIGGAICTVVERNSNILLSPLSHQFDKLILGPISEVGVLPKTIVIVLDALDECGRASDCKALLALLAQDFSQLPFSICTIVTSHAEIDINNVFEFQHNILAH
jgi:energy-coupling factor transporter ATP-binding protein EcfA2